jgi:DnaA-like protein
MKDPEEILAAVCAVFHVSLAELIGLRRFQRIAQARHAAAWALSQRGLGKTEIGELLHRDHSTISTSIKQAAELDASDPAFAAKLRALRAALDPAAPAEAPQPSRRMSQRPVDGLSWWVATNRRLWARPDVA